MPLHPDFQRLFAAPGPRPSVSDDTPVAARNLIAAGREALGTGPDIRHVTQFWIPVDGGTIEARLYVDHSPAAGLLVYLHGGGWVAGSLDDYAATARWLAKRSGAAVLLVDYRLAPEHPFPIGLQDCTVAIEWAAEHAATLLGRPAPLLVGGDSAGGNLAIVATRELSQRLPIAGAVLAYPVCDCCFDRPSYLEFGDSLPFKRRDMMWFFSHYAARSLHTDARVSPIRASWSGTLPPVSIVTAGCDILRDEGEAFAHTLTAAGVPVVLKCFHDLPHGFLRYANVAPCADDAVSYVASEIARLCRGPAP